MKNVSLYIMKTKELIGLITVMLAVFVLLTACATQPAQPSTAPAQQPAAQPGPETAETPAPQVPAGTTAAGTEPAETAPAEYSSDILPLVEKSRKISSYSYTFKSNIKNSFGKYEEELYYVSVKGDKAKKSYQTAKKSGLSFFYSDIYLDMAAKTAVATCSIEYLSCKEWKDAYNIDYSSEALAMTPLGLMQTLPASAKIVGTETFDDRSTVILEYLNSLGKKEKLNVDTFYGLPLRRTITEVQEEDEVILERYSFTKMDVGVVKTSDVTLPSTYTVK